jgi:hypothetical protein
MTAIAWSLWQAERERSAARAEALEALAFSEIVEPRAIAPLPSPVSARPPAAPSRVQAPAPLTTQDSNVAAFDETTGDDDWDYALRGTRMDDGDLADHSAGTRRPSVVPDQMFHTERPAGSAGRLWLALAAVALVITAGVVTYRAFHSPEIRAVVSASRGAARTNDAAPDTATGTHALELLSLRHTVGPDGAFTVTGLVQNPVDGDSVGEIDAVLYLFDDQGLYFAGGKAPLEVPDIAPGDESPFTIKVATSSGVSRYRVGFRRGDGRVLAHVDRRGQLPDGTSGEAIDARPALATPAGAIRRAEGAIVQ